MAEQWYSIVEYARAFAISDMTVRRRIRNGKLKAVLKDGKYYIPVVAGQPVSQPEPASHHKQVVRPVAPYHEDLTAREAAPAYNQRPPVIQPNPISQRPPQPQAPAPNPGNLHIPDALRRQIMGNDSTSVSAQTLVSFCEKALKLAAEAEARAKQVYQNRLTALEATVKAKDAEIANLCQQIEDLQLLVKVFEKGR